MKARIAIVAILTAATVSGRTARDGFGIGVIIGEPTGVSAKKWTDREHAFDAAAAWSFSEDDAVRLHADYLVHNFGVIRTDASTGRLPFYYGIGGRILIFDNDRRGDDHDTRLGVRFPLGFSFLFTRAPFDIFAEIVPVLDIVPDSDFGLDAAIGARFYF